MALLPAALIIKCQTRVSKQFGDINDQTTGNPQGVGPIADRPVISTPAHLPDY